LANSHPYLPRPWDPCSHRHCVLGSGNPDGNNGSAGPGSKIGGSIEEAFDLVADLSPTFWKDQQYGTRIEE